MDSNAKKSILLVEDEAIIALQESKQLQKVGYSVIHSLTGEKAIEIVSSNPGGIDLILMDIDLGKGISGTQAAERILQTNDIPILFLSSHTEPEIVHKTEEITNYGYVVKASSFTVLDASIKMAFKLFASKRQLDLNSMEIETRNEELQVSLENLRKTSGRLAISEEKFSKAFQLNPDAINLNRLSDGVYVDINEGFSKIMGYMREDVIGHSSLPGDLGIWVNTEDRVRLVRGLSEYGEVANLVAEFRKKDGTTTIGLMSARIMEIEGEKCVLSITRDMADWIRAKDELIATKGILKSTMDNQKDIFILSIDKEFNCMYCNQAYTDSKSKSIGIEIVAGCNLMKTLPVDIFFQKALPYFNSALLGQSSRVLEEYESFGFFLESSYNPIHSESGEIIGATVFATDISERRKNGKEFRDRDELHRAIIQTAIDGYWLSDIEGHILDANESYCKMSGYGKEELVTMGISDISADQSDEVIRNNIKRLMTLGVQRFDAKHRRKDGTILEVEVSVQYQPIGGGRIVSFFRDIGEQRKNVSEILERRKYLETIINTTQDGFFITNEEGHFLDVNRAYCQITGYSREELLQLHLCDINDRISLEQMHSRIAMIMKDGFQLFDSTIRTKAGTHVIVEVSSSWIPLYGHFTSFCHDITSRRDAERGLAESEHRFRTAFSNAPIGISLTEFDGRLTSVNQTLCDMLGYPMDEVNNSTFMQLTHPDDVALSLDHTKKLHDGFYETTRFQKRYIHRDGHVIWADISMSVMKDNIGVPRNFIAHIMDISDKKVQEAELRTSEAKLFAILQNCHDAIGVHVDGIWVTCNPAALRMFGLSSEDELLRKPIVNVIIPSERSRIIEYVRSRISENPAPSAYVTKGLRKDGTDFDMEVNVSSYMLEGKRHVLVILRDISEQERAAKALKESEERYRQLFGNMLEGCALQEIVTDEEGKPVDFRFLDANPAYEHHTGQKPRDIIGKTILELMPDADKKQIEEYGNVALTGEPMSYEYHSKTFDRYIRIKSFRPQSGRFATIFEDVSEWRKAEDEVKRRSDELQATLVTITAGVSRIRDRKVVWANPSHDTIFGYSHGELLGKETSTLYPDHESFERFGKEAYPQMITGSPVTIERLMKRKGGELFWCSLTGRLLDKGKPEEGSIWMVRDISDRKRSEAELQSALKEKQNLLYEIQHRAKNSFSMISSLIHLTALGEVPKQAVPILHELDTKVRSIAELYTMLYSSGSFAEVRMDEYILQVVSSLLSGLASRIALSTDFDRLTLHPREAAPIGLITTELITNAIKYAFPEGGEGKISLSLHTRDSENILEVEDDGVGLPNGFDISNGSGTGLQLVLALAGQLGGEFSISNATIGTKSRLVWKEKEH